MRPALLLARLFAALFLHILRNPRIEAYGTVLRTTIVALPLHWVASAFPVATWWAIVAKLRLLSLRSLSGLLLLGELGDDDMTQLGAHWRQ